MASELSRGANQSAVAKSCAVFGGGAVVGALCPQSSVAKPTSAEVRKGGREMKREMAPSCCHVLRFITGALRFALAFATASAASELLA
jgi:hypothetical protein